MNLPTGTVTFLFTDIEGSTRLWEEHPDPMRLALARHDALLRQAIEAHDGVVFKTIGDAFCAVFSSARDAVAAGLAAQHTLYAEPWPAPVKLIVRMAFNSGVAEQRNQDYFGSTLNRISRLLAAGHGGQILLSYATQQLVQDHLPEGACLRDLGEVQLKDLPRPEQVFQLVHPDLPDTFPPLRSQPILSNNLPQQLTDFIGREYEIAEITRLLSTTRLLTLTGPGGSGKTRLAIRVASDLLEGYPGGVWFVELDNVRDRSDVPTAIALALTNLELKPNTDLLDQIINYLRSRQALLILDNFEQIVSAATIVNDLLRACPDLTCLVTSRECLRISGEQEYAVDPLSVPPPGRIQPHWTQFESVQLFERRCQNFKPDYAITAETAPTVCELCRRLDGIPLAIELAAARVRAISPQELLQRLTRRLDMLATNQRDLPDRQRTLRGAIDWSFDLLTEDERAIFAELAVFSGGFSLEAAEAVCLTFGAFDAVFSLRDKSLLRIEETNGETRFFMLEIIRDYSLEKLKQTDKLAELRTRHAHYFLTHAKEWASKLTGTDAAAAMREFTSNIANLRDAMDWAISENDTELTIEFGISLFNFLRRSCWHEECDKRLLAAQQAASEARDPVKEARLLNQRGLIAMDRSNLDTAAELFTQSYEIARSVDNKERILAARINLGNIYFMRWEFEQAREQWEQCLELAIGTRFEGMIHTDLGIIASDQGRDEEAATYFQQAQTIQSHTGNQEGEAYALYGSSELYRNQGQYAEAIVRLKQAHDLFKELGNQPGICETLIELGHNHLAMQRLTEAEEYLNQALKMAKDSDDLRQQATALNLMGQLSMQRAERERALRHFDCSLDSAYKIHDLKQIADVLHHYSEILWDLGDRRQAYLTLWVVEREYQLRGSRETAEIDRKLQEWREMFGPASEELTAEAARLNLETVHTHTALVPVSPTPCSNISQ